MTRVLISAASTVVRSGLEAAVRAGEALEFGGALSLEELRASPEPDSDVVLAGLSSPDEDTLRWLSEVLCPVLLLADEPDAQDLAGNLRGVLRFSASPEEIAAALVAVAAGLAVTHPSTLEKRHQSSLAELDEPLTPREVEVLRLLAEGLSNKLIAHGLAISEHTVKFHVTQILAKLRASSRTDAVMQGIRRGLVLV